MFEFGYRLLIADRLKTLSVYIRSTGALKITNEVPLANISECKHQCVISGYLSRCQARHILAENVHSLSQRLFKRSGQPSQDSFISHD